MISSINGVTYASISTIRGTATASLSRIYGVALSASPPSIAGVATPIGSTGSLDHSLGLTTLNNDIIVVFVESNNQAVTMVTSGYTEATDSPASNAGTNPTRLTVFWKRSGGGETSAEVNGTADHIVVAAVVVRGCVTSGDPFDVTNATNGATGTSITIPGDTTTVNNCIVLAAVATTNPNLSSSNFSSWANSDLTSVTERADQSVNLNAGGGIGIVSGIKASAGAFGDTTATQSGSREWCGWVGALKPQ